MVWESTVSSICFMIVMVSVRVATLLCLTL